MLNRIYASLSILFLSALAVMSQGNIARAQSTSEVLEFSQASYTIAQTANSVTLTVDRTGGTAGIARVHYATQDGTAVSNVDYMPTFGVLTWADGDSAPKSITVAILNSGSSTQGLAFGVKLFRPRDANLASARTATVNITTATSAGNLVVASPSYSIPVTGNTVNVSVQRTGGASGVVSVEHSTVDGTAIAGTNYMASSGTLVWADGDVTPKTFGVPIVDSNFTGNKTFTVALSNPTGGAAVSNPSSASVMIAVSYTHLTLPTNREV